MHRSCVVCVLVVDFDVEEIMEEFTMCMTNDIDKIREITGYEPGKASIYGVLKPMEWILQENQ